MDQNMSEKDNKIKVFASDDNLKSLGELLSNETSRKIIKYLMENEMYTNEISTKLDIRVSLVIHHLKKLEELGLLEITNKKIKRKGEEHRFFKIDSDIFITLDKNKEEVKENGVLNRVFREGTKFAVLGFISTVTLFFSGGFNQSELHKIPERGLPNLIEISPFIYPMLVLIIGLSVFYFWKNKSKW